MTTFALSAIMDAIAATIRTAGVADIVYPYPASSFQPPCAIVNYPPSGGIKFDMTFKRGADEATFPVMFVVGSVNDLAARDALSAIIDGAVSIKASLEASTAALAAVVSTVRVTDCSVEFLTMPPEMGSVEFLAARFDVEVTT